MATLRDNGNPYWCAASNRGCVFAVRGGWVHRLRILDEANRPLPPAHHELLERVERAPEGAPDSRPLRSASCWVRVIRIQFPTFQAHRGRRRRERGERAEAAAPRGGRSLSEARGGLAVGYASYCDDDLNDEPEHCRHCGALLHEVSPYECDDVDAAMLEQHNPGCGAVARALEARR